MQEEKVIRKQEINSINSNIIEDTKKSTERKIKENLIDAEEHKDPKVEIITKNNDKMNNNGNIISNNKPQQQIAEKVEIKLNEKINTNSINKITNSNNLNISNEFEKFNCIVLCITICSALLFSLFVLALNFSLVIIFLYYKNNCKECKSELYPKINKILLNYLGIFIVRILYIIFIICITIFKKIRKFCKIIGLFYLL